MLNVCVLQQAVDRPDGRAFAFRGRSFALNCRPAAAIGWTLGASTADRAASLKSVSPAFNRITPVFAAVPH